MLAPDRSQRALVAVGIALVHAVVLYGLANIAPRLKSVTVETPVAVRFLTESQLAPQWQPPQVRFEPPDVWVPVPELMPVARASEPVTIRSTTSIPPPASPVQVEVDRSIPKRVAAVEYVREPAPRYPPQSRRLREQGLVVLRVVIDERGVACDIDIENSSGYARLDRAAKDAVARAEFRPYIEDGKPRRALVLIPIEFALNRSTA